jgi:uncharacterized membrane protein YdjX (TVP38/TMEM64 family)
VDPQLDQAPTSNPEFSFASNAEPGEPTPESAAGKGKLLLFIGLGLAILTVGFLFRDSLTLERLAEQEQQLRRYQTDSPVISYLAALAVYVLITGLSLPGAGALTLVYGWFFGFGIALVLVSFASTAGATLAMLSSRYLLRDWVTKKYGAQLGKVMEQSEQEGGYYLFSLRLIPAVPFFLINLAMGLTRIPVWTFWWVSQVGMLAGTAVYVFAGSRVPNLQTLAEDGVTAVIEPQRLILLTIAFALLGLFPLMIKLIRNRLQGQRTE